MAAKGYFDALVKLGELASDSQGSKELGERWNGQEEQTHVDKWKETDKHSRDREIKA